MGDEVVAKNRKNDSSSFEGLFGNLTVSKENIVVESEKEQPVQTVVNKTIVAAKPTTSKKRGRPASTRERKKGVTFTVLPSVYKEFSECVGNTGSGKSASEIIEDFMLQFIAENK